MRVKKSPKITKCSSQASTGDRLQAAVVNHQAGRLSQAANCYRQILNLEPAHPDALHLLGVTFQQAGNFNTACRLIGQAIDSNPLEPAYYNNFGTTLKEQGKLDLALWNYRKAIDLDQDFADAHYNLGNALKKRGKLDESFHHLAIAISLRPDFAEAHGNLGNVFQAKRDSPRAITCYRHALRLNPGLKEPHNNLGNALLELGRIAAAEGCFRKALDIDCRYAEALSNLGRVLKAQGRLDDAIQCFWRVLLYRPSFVEPCNNLGNALKDLGRYDEAALLLKRALVLVCDFAEAHVNLGTVRQAQVKFEEAIECYKLALVYKPDLAEAYTNLAITLADQCKLDDAADLYRRAIRLKPSHAKTYSNYLMSLHYCHGFSQAMLLAEHRRYADVFEAPLKATWHHSERQSYTQRKIKIGFVSGDLYAHPVAFFLESIFAELDRQTLEVFLYPTRIKHDAMTQRLRASGFTWRPLTGSSEEDAAHMIRKDGIDILVDLSGHTAYNFLRLFARKPAPIQVTWLGYFATTGLQAMNYILCDRIVLPPEDRNRFVEQPWYLPETRLCFSPPEEDASVGELPGIANGFITFGCFNNLTKVNESVIALWSQVLHAVPDSRLFLKARQLGNLSSQQALLAEFARHQIAANRIMLEGSSSRLDYLTAYHRIDMALDPFPFTGGTTTMEGLWMGVPVITRKGDCFIARQGESILRNAGLPDWIAIDNEAYVAIAMEQSGNRSRLATLRAGLRSQVLASPLCDAPRFARNLESAFREMWQAYCENPAQ